MIEFYNKLHEIALSEMQQFEEEFSAQPTEEMTTISKEITLKNRLVINISKYFFGGVSVNFHLKNHIDFYTFEDLIAYEYVPEEFQKLEFLEVDSRELTKVKMVSPKRNTKLKHLPLSK